MRKRKYSSLPSCNSHVQLHMGAPLPTVHNIVATSQIVSSLPTLDLNRVHAMLPFSFYDQNKFAAITVRLHEPDCTTLLFSSGKLVVTGCRTWYECVYASLFIADLLRECLPGHAFTLATCDVQNMVAHVEIPVGEHGCLDLHGMYEHMALNCTYQRKMFPGLIFRPESSPVVLLCFFSGRVLRLEPPVARAQVVCRGADERAVPATLLAGLAQARQKPRTRVPTDTAALS